ncbi:hypothetical protein F6R98_15325 [Candidatus Methylospira mobilis]|uniref:Phosphate ABC transporter substrate-binding protein n=1 Tax=Candidatus Methylospira mobilis TaxID=1808979 RepID=A0A5Q0BL26_9GAMM|nr:hypothetical protein [Candidatus Methylospira mobilis]QFY43832.1 hypothetical protein F6R98_15325 [Candidatus Methylospira mobilis]WNV04824.1 hypothetical protein RP726_00035 [Candidatus Methylospira mobilis]
MTRVFLPFLLLLFSVLPVQADIYIIVNKDLHQEQLDKNDIASIYLLKKRSWTNGDNIMPINLPAQSTVRSRFTSAIFNSSPEKLSSYWDEMLFRGVNPPIIQNSEQAVILFVERVKGAIGYVETRPQNPQIKIIQQFPGN